LPEQRGKESMAGGCRIGTGTPQKGGRGVKELKELRGGGQQMSSRSEPLCREDKGLIEKKRKRKPPSSKEEE